MEIFEGQTDEWSSEVRPITFLEDKQIPHLPAPLVWVNCCGLLSLEVLTQVVSNDPPRGRYRIISTQTLRGRGAVPALMLLKLLVSQPHRFASNDWLSTQMQQEMERGALVRLDTMASQLRTLLCGLEGEQTSALRLLLVEYLRNGRGSGPGYRLAPYPLIWLDTEALIWNVTQSTRMERFGDDALPWWERAYALASRGEYLPDDPYSEWAQGPREAVEGALRQSVHALARLYMAQQGEAGTEEAVRLLRNYWLSHKTDEDALRPLMELLGKSERYQEAETYYEQLCETLNATEIGKQPDERTHDICEFLRTKQTHREQKTSHHADIIKAEKTPASFFPDPQQDETFSPFSHAVTQGIIEAVRKLEVQKKSFISDTLLEQELESSTGVDRREASKLLGMLGFTVFTAPHRLFDTLYTAQPEQSWIDPGTLSLFEMLTETCLRLSEGNHLTTAERVLWSYLPQVEAFAQQSSEQQHVAANIVSQSYLIAASLVGHHNDLQARQRFSEQAWLYGTLAQDGNLQVAALRQLAVTFDYLERPQKVLQTYQRTFPYLDTISPRLRACIYAALSGVYAQLKQKQEAARFIGLAYEQFPETTEDEPSVLRLINANYHTIILWDGLNHLELDQPQRAEHIFAQLDVLTPTVQIPERIRIELLNYRSKAFIAVKNMEQACTYLEGAVKASIELHSARRLREAFIVFQQLREQWPYEQRVQQLGDHFFHSLINHTQ